MMNMGWCVVAIVCTAGNRISTTHRNNNNVTKFDAGLLYSKIIDINQTKETQICKTGNTIHIIIYITLVLYEISQNETCFGSGSF